ncbi:MAG: hypothetical protein JRJ84_12565 [Deltaproteobacteria bacterium]|nr:hypothetical protein [Deltaproteobacteria bacterium]
MRLSLLVACALLAACDSLKTCEKAGIDEEVAAYYEVTLANEGGGIQVVFDPSPASEVWLEDETPEIIWHIRCDGEKPDDEDSPPIVCLDSPIAIGAAAPTGATNPVETQDLEEGPVYRARVQDTDIECRGQIRHGESSPFTVTIGR